MSCYPFEPTLSSSAHHSEVRKDRPQHQSAYGHGTMGRGLAWRKGCISQPLAAVSGLWVLKRRSCRAVSEWVVSGFQEHSLPILVSPKPLEEKQENRVNLKEMARQNDGGRVTAAWVALLPPQPLCREEGVEGAALSRLACGKRGPLSGSLTLRPTLKKRVAHSILMQPPLLLFSR